MSMSIVILCLLLILQTWNIFNLIAMILAQEDSTGHRAARPGPHNHRARAPEALSHSKRRHCNKREARMWQ